MNLRSQDCTETLTEARNAFNDGNIEAIPGLLEPCIRSGFTKEEKVQAYKLLIQAYLFEDKVKEAEETLLKLKRTNPVYEIDQLNDVAEFIALFNEYKTTALMAFGGFAGVHFPSFQILEPFSNGSLLEDEYAPTYERTNVFFQAGARITYQPYQNIELMFDPMFMSTQYRYTNATKDWYGNDETTVFDESLSFIHFPLSVAYNYPIRGIVPYGYAGFDLALALSSSITPTIDTDDLFEGAAIETNIDYRNKLTKNIVVGAGVKLKIQTLYLYLELRDHIALDNMTVTTNRYSFDTDKIGSYRVVEDNFKMYDFMVNVGLVWSLYTHKRINP